MKQLLRAAVSITVLIVAIWVFDWNKLLSTVAKVDPAIYLLALALAFIHFLPMFLRWAYLVRKIVPHSLLYHAGVYYYASFLNTFTPANFGGDVYRVAQLRPLSGSREILLVLLKERVVGLIGLETGFLLFYFLMDLSGAALPHLLQISAAIIGAALVMTSLSPWLLAFLSRYTGGRLKQLLADIQSAFVFTGVGELVILLALSLSALVVWIAAIQLLAWNLNLGLGFVALGTVAILTELVRLVPISLQGIGVREGAFAFLAGLCGAKPEVAFVVATLAYLTLSLSLAMCGATGWFLGLIRRRNEGA